MGKTYEIFCQRGLNKDDCRFKKQDSELICVQCSFAGFIERKKCNSNTESFTCDTKANTKNNEQ